MRQGARDHSTPTSHLTSRRWRLSRAASWATAPPRRPAGCSTTRYALDHDGTILDARIVPPTSPNQAGVADQTDWWQVDARTFAAGGRSYDLVTTHFLHPPDEGMVEVTRRLAEAVGPGGHMLVVGHAPSEAFTHLTASQRRAMFLAKELLLGLPDEFEAHVVEQRLRTMTRDGMTVDVHDSTLLARRQP